MNPMHGRMALYLTLNGLSFDVRLPTRKPPVRCFGSLAIDCRPHRVNRHGRRQGSGDRWRVADPRTHHIHHRLVRRRHRRGSRNDALPSQDVQTPIPGHLRAHPRLLACYTPASGFPELPRDGPTLTPKGARKHGHLRWVLPTKAQ